MNTPCKPKTSYYIYGFLSCLVLVLLALIVYSVILQKRIEKRGGKTSWLVNSKANVSVYTILTGIQPTILSYLPSNEQESARIIFNKLKDTEALLGENDIRDLSNAHRVFIQQMEISKPDQMEAPSRQYLEEVKRVCNRH